MKPVFSSKPTGKEYEPLVHNLNENTMTYSNKLKQTCFELYCDNRSPEEIVRTIGAKLHRNTIWNWIGKENWQERKAKIQEKTMKKLDANLAETTARQLSLTKFVEAKWFNKFRDDPVFQDTVISRMSSDDFIAMMEQERKLLGGYTENVNVDVNLMSIEIQAVLTKVIEEKRLTIAKEKPKEVTYESNK